MSELTTIDKLNVFLEKLEPDFSRLKLNNKLDFEQEALFASNLLAKNNYLLGIARNNPQSLKSSMLNIATIGLTLNPAMGLAYLIPRKNEICADISYLGLIKLAQDTGSVKHIKAELVHEKDRFEIRGAFKEPEHYYSPFGDRGKIVGAYVTALTPDGSFLTTVMHIDEIYTIRDSSESYKNERTRPYSPWVKHEGEMIKKTVIRRAYKSWSKSENNILAQAVKISDDAQAIEYKSEWQIEQEQLDKDFPIPPEEKEIGAPTYRVQHAKFRGKQLKDIDTQEMEDYLILLDKRHSKKDSVPKQWELELKQSMEIYLEAIESEVME